MIQRKWWQKIVLWFRTLYVCPIIGPLDHIGNKIPFYKIEELNKNLRIKHESSFPPVNNGILYYDSILKPITKVIAKCSWYPRQDVLINFSDQWDETTTNKSYLFYKDRMTGSIFILLHEKDVLPINYLYDVSDVPNIEKFIESCETSNRSKKVFGV